VFRVTARRPNGTPARASALTIAAHDAPIGNYPSNENTPDPCCAPQQKTASVRLTARDAHIFIRPLEHALPRCDGFPGESAHAPERLFVKGVGENVALAEPSKLRAKRDGPFCSESG